MGNALKWHWVKEPLTLSGHVHMQLRAAHSVVLQSAHAVAENRKAADSGFQQYINGIPGATTFGFVLNPSYENDNVIDFIAEVTIDDAK
eukprot:scaffold147723_cov22-Tisochrysis_lutea.AAC.2